ncbi:uncharacterized protein J3R85_003987 [Psidium guajava]|nr:uncharacterized protein J3R85_003987 [Psidium guajava]
MEGWMNNYNLKHNPEYFSRVFVVTDPVVTETCCVNLHT